MKRTAIALTLVMTLLFSALAGVTLVNVVKANFIIYLPTIEIKSDGGIAPETDYIHQVGNVYTLMADLSQQYAVTIKCSNIVFDGAGHVINGSTKGEDAKYISGYGNTGLRVEGVTNVTVKDIAVSGFESGHILLDNCSNCTILRVTSSCSLRNCSFITIAENNLAIFYVSDSVNNVINRNNISSLGMESSTAFFFKNNFVSKPNRILYVSAMWDNSSVGNYWSDYLAKYPNASEIGSSGIGDTPYVIDANNVDHYPLMAPVDNTPPSIEIPSPESRTYDTSSIQLDFTVNGAVSQITYTLDGEANITITGNTTLTGLANGDHDLTIYAWDEAGNVGASETVYFAVDVPFPTVPVAFASGTSAIAIAAGLLIYFKKRNH